MNDDSRAVFQIPGMYKQTSAYATTITAADQASVVHEVSQAKHVPHFAHNFSANREAANEARKIYEELNAVSEEIMECRKAAISQLL